MPSERQRWARAVVCVVSCGLLLSGVTADLASALPPPLYDNLGTLHHAISTDSDVAQRAYIEALTTRYLGSLRASRATLDKAYADAMRVVWKTHPDDPDAGVLFA